MRWDLRWLIRSDPVSVARQRRLRARERIVGFSAVGLLFVVSFAVQGVWAGVLVGLGFLGAAHLAYGDLRAAGGLHPPNRARLLQVAGCLVAIFGGFAIMRWG